MIVALNGERQGEWGSTGSEHTSGGQWLSGLKKLDVSTSYS